MVNRQLFGSVFISSFAGEQIHESIKLLTDGNY